MADSTLPLNAGTGGKTLDTESLTGAGSATVERQRLEVAGAALAEIARVMNSAPVGTEYALVTRPIAPASQTVVGTVAVSNFPGTQPVSGTITAAQATAANLLATVTQGGAGATAWKVDGSAVTQPVSGTVTATVANATLASMAAATSNPTGVVSLGNSLGKALVMKTGTLASSAVTADQVVLTYTVTTGKTFYLEYIEFVARLTTFATTATNFGTISLENPSGTKLLTTEIFHAGTYPACIYLLSEPIPVASATVIRAVCTPSATTAFTWRANFGGYEK